VSGSDDRTIKLWDLNTENCLKTILGHSDSVSSLLNLSEMEIASCSKDNTIKLWNYLKGDRIKTLTGDTSPVYCIEKLNEIQIVSGSGNSIKIWDI